MEMQHVRYFVALAHALNFARAAKRCSVSPSALTRAIQQLEHEMGGPLFHRERGNTHLSELGRIMLPYLALVDESCRAARHQALELKRLDQATLKIATMCTIGPQIVSNFLVRFQTQHPGVEIKVIDTGASQMLDMLSKGDIEIAVGEVPRELSDSLYQLPIFEERFVVVLPPDHRLLSQDAIRATDIDGEPYISRSRCEGIEPIRKELLSRGVRLHQVFSSPRDDWVLGMIKAGQGLGFFPEFAVVDQELDVRPLVEPSFTRTIYVSTLSGRSHSPIVGAFIREVRLYPWPKSQPQAATRDTIFLSQKMAAFC